MCLYIILSTTTKKHLIELNQKNTYVINNKSQACLQNKYFKFCILLVASTFELTLTFKIPIITILNIKNEK